MLPLFTIQTVGWECQLFRFSAKIAPVDQELKCTKNRLFLQMCLYEQVRPNCSLVTLAIRLLLNKAIFPFLVWESTILTIVSFGFKFILKLSNFLTAVALAVHHSQTCAKLSKDYICQPTQIKEEKAVKSAYLAYPGSQLTYTCLGVGKVFENTSQPIDNSSYCGTFDDNPLPHATFVFKAGGSCIGKEF